MQSLVLACVVQVVGIIACGVEHVQCLILVCAMLDLGLCAIVSRLMC